MDNQRKLTWKIKAIPILEFLIERSWSECSSSPADYPSQLTSSHTLRSSRARTRTRRYLSRIPRIPRALTCVTQPEALKTRNPTNMLALRRQSETCVCLIWRRPVSPSLTSAARDTRVAQDAAFTPCARSQESKAMTYCEGGKGKNYNKIIIMYLYRWDWSMLSVSLGD